MKKLIIDRVLLIFTVLVIIVMVYFGYLLVNRINVKRSITKDIYEILNDYQIKKDTKKIRIIIYSKSNFSTKVSYNIEFTNDSYDKLEYDKQKDIIRYIKKLSFKGNKKKYYINKVTIYANDNKYEYNKLFRKNDKVYGVGELDTDSATDTIKEKWEEIKDKFTN